MKKIILLPLIAFICIANIAFGQSGQSTVNTSQIFKNDLKVIYITKDVNLHFRTPEPVQFVDLSTSRMIGDLPTENVVRVKIQQTEEENTFVNDTLRKTIEVPLDYRDNQELGIVTIVGQSFMAQYKIVYKIPEYSAKVLTNIEISPNDMQPLEYPQYEFSNVELKRFALDRIKEKSKKPIRKEKTLGLVSQLNSVYTLGDYVFLDITFQNKTNLAYDIDQLIFSIDDKKVYKSTNNQSITIEPVYQLYDNKRFKRNYRNVYVFKKFTYPNNKVLNIRLVEDQLSGRTINLEIKYSDILQADTF